MTSEVEVTDFTPRTKVLGQTGKPTLLCRWRVALPCDCAAWVGIRADTQEAATAVVPCGEDHLPLADRFNQAMLASLYVPTDRQLVDVVAQMLEAASLDG